MWQRAGNATEKSQSKIMGPKEAGGGQIREPAWSGAAESPILA